jgi:hypothetical protein
MHNRSRNRFGIASCILSIAASALLAGLHAAAQPRPAAPARPSPPAPAASAAPAAVPTDRDVAATQRELIKLLRLSPTLTTVVARDPSLLANQEYVTRTNPQLAEFLGSHPEVGRNPDFYLFTHFKNDGEGSDEALERVVFADLFRNEDRSAFRDVVSNLVPLLAFAIFLVAAYWIMRVVLENRRWNRVFKLQSDVHGKLIDKFGSNQELAAYMQTEAGRRFLEAAPIPVTLGTEQRVPNAVARVLTPIQIGVVLVLLGIGLLFLRHAATDMELPMLVLGTVILMPGIGFIISAGITWVLAARLGMMPQKPEPPCAAPPANRFDAPFGSSERQ